MIQLEYLMGTFRTFTPTDVLDILVVAYITYQILKLVKETRAIQLVKGLAVLLLLYSLAFYLKLKAMTFIMENVLQIGAIALLVVFQPELRRALEQVGRTKVSYLNIFNQSVDEKQEEQQKWKKAITAICESCVSLSRKKIGALIVIERQTRLGEIIKTGTLVGAEPSSEIIGNIFFPNSPLHDGAMIIRSGKIYAAGCFLPLSDNHEISKELGTRHRAALGMSENSDAIIIVVSEETGVITLAMNGRLNRNYTLEELHDTLSAELILSDEASADNKKPMFWKVKNNEKK